LRSATIISMSWRRRATSSPSARACSSGTARLGPDLLGEASDDLGVESIGLGQAPGGSGEVADLPRIDHGERQRRRRDRRRDRHFVPAGCLDHDHGRRQRPQPVDQRCQAFAVARDGESLSRRPDVAIQALARDIDADKVRFHLDPSLQMRARLAAQATVRVRWNGGRGTMLSDDLCGSRHNRAPVRHRSTDPTTARAR
jgi:hypothetical protein